MCYNIEQLFVWGVGMEKNVYMSERLYELINDIAAVNETEQMMVFGGATIGNTIVINEKSFDHFDDDKIYNSSKDYMEVPLSELEKQMIINRELGNDTFFMAHSHRNLSPFEFMHGDLSFEDEEISKKLRGMCYKHGLEYYDGITTGKRLYFWSTLNDYKPQMMDCYVGDSKIKYNKLTQLTEDIEHRYR